MLPGARSPLGRLFIEQSAPAATDPRLGGVALNPSGRVHIALGGVPASVANGFAFTGSGALCCASSPVIHHWNNGYPFTIGDELAIQNLDPTPNHGWVGGIAVDANGIFVLDAITPTVSAFSSGFSNGFGA